MTDEKKEMVANGIASAITYLDDDAIDTILDAIEKAAINTGGWIQFTIFAATKLIRFVLKVPDDDVDQSKPV